jgi:hypothetical protein
VITRKRPGESLESLRISDRTAGVAVYQAATQNYDVAGFETDQFPAFVVSDVGVKQNLKIADELAPAVQQFLLAVRS